MAWEPSTASWALLVAGVVNLAILAIALRRHRVRGGVPFAVLLLSVAVYCFGDGYRLGATTLATYVRAHLVTTVGYGVMPPAFLLFALEYSGHEEWVNRRTIAGLAVEPMALYALTLTMPSHDLLWTFHRLDLSGPLPVVEWTTGAAYWVHVTYVYVLVIAAVLLLCRAVVNRRRAYRRQAMVVLGGASLPVLFSLVWLFGLTPYETLDPTPFSFTITSVVFAAALFRYGFLDVVPVARHTLVEEVDDPIVVLDTDDRVADLNPAAKRLFGADAIGAPASGVTPSIPTSADDAGAAPASTDRHAAVRADDDALIPGRPDDEATVVETSTGDRHFDCKLTPLSDDRGNRIGTLVIFRDVTERRRIRKRYQTLIERSSDVIGIIDETAEFRYLSPSVESVLGYGPEELVGESLFAYVHPDDCDPLAAEFAAKVDEPGYADSYEARFRHADGEWRTIEAKGRNLLDDPHVEGIVLNARDVTERRRQERQLEAQNERLAEFASVVSHDLRNPLQVVSARVELARDTGDLDHLDPAIDATDRMEEIIDDVLRLARHGQTVEEPEPVAVDAIARQAWDTVECEDATLRCDADGTVEADPGLLRQAFENLFRNSVEHAHACDGDAADTPADGGGATTASEGDAAAETRPATGGGVTVEVGDLPDGFYVADDGPGVPPEVRDSIFEYGATGDGDGTGIGLAVVSRIAAAHGWDVSVTDADGGGARFEFRT